MNPRLILFLKTAIIIVGVILFFIFLFSFLMGEKQVFSPIPIKKGVKVVPLKP